MVIVILLKLKLIRHSLNLNDIVWKCKNKNLKNQTSNTLNLKFTPKDVGMLYGIHCTVISKNEWHKFTLHDSEILLCLTILPPKN